MTDPAFDVYFVDNFLPALTARDYLLEVEQTVELPAEYGPPAPYQNSKRMRVAGPHFGLDSSDVASVYPPPNSQDRYSNILPCVVLVNRGLPWQITIGGPLSGPQVAPWMALFLVTPEEIVAPPDQNASGNLNGTRVIPLTEYLNPPSGVFGPQFTEHEKQAFEKQYEKLSVTVVDVTRELFSAIAPALDELPFLAHVREIETEHQEISKVGEDGWVASVLGNRFPSGSKSGVYIAHLVSLEGFGGVLPGSGTVPESASAVRLVSLASWAFNSLEGGGDFAKLMAQLDSNTLRMPELVKDPGTEPEKEIAAALACGYTAMPYQTRLGELTTGWYRGPCLPVPMQRNMQPSYPAAEAGLIYDWNREAKTSRGLFDLSFGTAWQTGRLCALADRQFVTALLAWIRENNTIAQLLAERIALFQRYPSFELPNEVEELLSPDLLRRSSRRFFIETLAPMMSPPDPRVNRDLPLHLAEPRPLLGPPRDATGILSQLERYPGVVSPASYLDHLSGGSAGLPAGLRSRGAR
jgi:hypothetical protein